MKWSIHCVKEWKFLALLTQECSGSSRQLQPWVGNCNMSSVSHTLSQVNLNLLLTTKFSTSANEKCQNMFHKFQLSACNGHLFSNIVGKHHIIMFTSLQAKNSECYETWKNTEIHKKWIFLIKEIFSSSVSVSYFLENQDFQEFWNENEMLGNYTAFTACLHVVMMHVHCASGHGNTEHYLHQFCLSVMTAQATVREGDYNIFWDKRMIPYLLNYRLLTATP